MGATRDPPSRGPVRHFTVFRVLLCPEVRSVRARGLDRLAGRSLPGFSPPEGLPVLKPGESHPLRSRAWPCRASTDPLAVHGRSPA